MSKRFAFQGTLRSVVLGVLLCLVGGPVAADVIRISGVGLSTPLLQRLAELYRKQEPGDTVSVVLPPLGTDGSLRALAAGQLELAVSGRPLKPDEAAMLGRAVELASTALGFATSDGVRAAGISALEVADIYAGRLLRWDNDQPIRLIMRAERESDTKLVRGLSAETNAAMDLAFKRKGLVVADNDLDMLRLLESVPGSFGPLTTGLASLQGSRVRFLPLNGVVPGVRALAEGRYSLVKTLLVVEPKAPSKAAARFAAFLKSPPAARLMAAAEFLPAR